VHTLAQSRQETLSHNSIPFWSEDIPVKASDGSDGQVRVVQQTGKVTPVHVPPWSGDSESTAWAIWTGQEGAEENGLAVLLAHDFAFIFELALGLDGKSGLPLTDPPIVFAPLPPNLPHFWSRL
jgi:hypothetical protein